MLVGHRPSSLAGKVTPYTMSTWHEILLLGAIAGGTIFLGLPIGRMQNLSSATRAGLSALATGILIFLLWDVLSGAVEPIETAPRQPQLGRFCGPLGARRSPASGSA